MLRTFRPSIVGSQDGALVVGEDAPSVLEVGEALQVVLAEFVQRPWPILPSSTL